MNHFAKILTLGAALIASVSVASASPITGGLTISGSDTYNSSSITFNPSTGFVVQSSGTMAIAAPAPSSASLTSFSFASATGVTLFSVPASPASALLSFTINAPLTTSSIDSAGTLTLKGSGLLVESGYDNTIGAFTLTSNSSGNVTGFQIVSSIPAAATPEPNSLVLLGTGLMSAAGMLVRRRRIA